MWKKGEDIKMLGVLKPKDGATAPMLQEGIWYSKDLTNYVMEKASNSQIKKEQLENPDINVFTGKGLMKQKVKILLI